MTDDYVGCYITVSAKAGANTVTFGSYPDYGIGPFKLAGAVDIYSAVLADAESGSTGYIYTADQTVRALQGNRVPLAASTLTPKAHLISGR